MKEKIGGMVEIKWLWRRWATFLVGGCSYFLIAVIVWRLSDADALKWIALALICLIGLAHTIYLTGATVLDWAKVVAAARPGLTIGPMSAKSETQEEPDK